MSETTTDPAPAAESIQQGQEGTQDAPAQQQEGATQAVETPSEAAPEATTEAPKPRRADRHVANLTARLATERADREAAEKRAEAAEALLRAGKPDAAQPAPREESADRAQIRAEIEFDDKRAKLIEAGNKEFPDWVEKTNIIHGLGGTSNPAFMQALVELPNAPKIVAALADDTDLLVELLRKSPTAMAAQLGRMDAKMEQTPAKPISRAPTPAPKIEAANVLAEPDIYDEKLDMKTWAKLWDKRAPKHLRGY
jgi:hypothetical protein